MDNIIKLTKEQIVSILPKEALNLLPTGDSILLASIPIKNLKNFGFHLDNYTILCEITNQDNDLIIKPCQDENNCCSIFN